MHDEATHIPWLAKAIDMYGQRVLEVGAGWYSTPLIYAVCPKEWCLTLETTAQWVNAMKPFAGDRILHTPNIVEGAKVHLLANLVANPWNVVFIDCYLGEDRVAIAKLFLDMPCCIVGHDTEQAYWKPILDTAKFQRHFDLLTPRTSYFSNVLDVTK